MLMAHSLGNMLVSVAIQNWALPLQRAYSWYNQERIKGVKPFEAGLGRNEGGWGFNAAYYKRERYYDDDFGEWVDRIG